MLPYCDLIFAGTDDLAVAGVDPTAAGLVELCPTDHAATAFVTAGEAETTAIGVEDGTISNRVAVAPPAATVATAAGAGDAFAGAVLAARHGGVTDLRELAAIGNAAGAAAVAAVGPSETTGRATEE